jgi:hypothetical protein
MTYMQKTLISYAPFVAVLFVIVALFGFTKHASAQTYFVDLTGNGCNQSCQLMLNQYFLSNTSTSTNSNATTTTSTSTPSSSTWYPYQQYVNFETTNSYYKTGTPQNTNPYAYRAYTYFNNPTYSSYNTQPSYSNQFYTYYGSDANEQLKKYQQFTQPTYSTYTTQTRYVPQNTGFTITSGF